MTTTRTELDIEIEKLLAVPFEQFAVNPAFGSINFEKVLPELQNFRRLLAALSSSDLALVPQPKRNDIVSSIKVLADLIQQMNNFNLESANPTELRNTIQSGIIKNYNALFDKVAPYVPALFVGLDAVFESARRTIASTNEQQAQALADQRKVLEESHQALAAIKKITADAGVTQEAKHFSTAATEYATASNRWAAATVLVASLGVIWGLALIWVIPINPDAKPAEIVQQALAKIIVFTALYYALIFCARNYSANRHNYVVNKHKENSLGTFEAFVRAANSDNSIKNAVLLQATTSIFTAPPSGYSAGKEGDSEPPSKIIEITKMASEKPN